MAGVLKLLLYVNNAEREQRYLNAAAELGIECDVVRSFEHYFDTHEAKAYNGVLLDIVSSIRAPGFDRETLKTLMEVYPSLRLRWDPESNEIRTLMTGAGSGQKITIEQFAATYCNSFTPRGMRMYPRKSIHCNVVSSMYGDMPDDNCEHSVTLDLSPGGCLLYSVRKLAKGTCLWLSFLELMDNSPIYARVQWCQEWGKEMKIPGIGLQFVEIEPQQQMEIKAMVDGSSLAEVSFN